MWHWLARLFQHDRGAVDFTKVSQHTPVQPPTSTTPKVEPYTPPASPYDQLLARGIIDHTHLSTFTHYDPEVELFRVRGKRTKEELLDAIRKQKRHRK